MFIAKLESLLTHTAHSVILLEGTRNLPPESRHQLAAMGQHLAKAYPQTVFRSGNAPGADEAFAEGVASLPGSMLELLMPTPGMGKARRPTGARCVALQEVPEPERQHLTLESKAASPENHRIFDLYLRGQSGNPAYSKAQYLVRDALKVIGSPALKLAPATLALFFVDLNNPSGGGTGHTIRLCQRHSVPYFTQRDWLAFA